ncbi:MAG: type I-MYXAN CRISPR-associated protein Cas6/Cmx6 [Planctomycetota bacterium]|jgi:CRISPR-associated protein Cas6|nr:type I-MYXAN CRISPR-associated protein Cas6/Cmx6 [Planctomycetota bacterium]
MITNEPYVDLSYRIRSNSPLWSDHGFSLFGAISRLFPDAHEANGIGILPIAGSQIGERRIQLNEHSRLTLRIPSGDIARWLPLAGKTVDVAGVSLQVGIPEIRVLIPATALRSRLVTTKNCQDQSRFEAEIRRQLTAIGVSIQAIVSVGKRRTIRIHGKEVVGYELIIEGLTADESIAIQTAGLGGRRHMGCGVFVPLLPKVIQ